MSRKRSIKRLMALTLTGVMLLGANPSSASTTITTTEAATSTHALTTKDGTPKVSSKRLSKKDFVADGGEVDLFTAAPAYNDIAQRDIFARIYNHTSGKFTTSNPDAGKNPRFSCSDTSVLSVTYNGTYTAKSTGIAIVRVNNIEYPVAVVVNPASFAVDATEFKDYYSSQDKASLVEHVMRFEGDEEFLFGLDTIEFTYTGNPLNAAIDYENRTISMNTLKTGTRKITLRVNGMDTKVTWKVVTTKVKSNAILLKKGKTTTLKLKNSAPATAFDWTSSNPKVATVNKNGKVKAIKTGNAIITGTVKNQQVKVGTVVSVASKKKIKAIKTARSIGTVYGNGIYSQAKRMTRPYYDCSSLVWEAYRNNGCNFGTTWGNAPVAASECQYLEVRGKAVGKFKSKNVTKMKYNAGDVMFRTNTGNGRYRGINHIEMITGYQFNGFSEEGKASVTLTWANRIPSYTTTINKCDLICRP